MEFDYTPEQIHLRKSVREFAESEITPHVMEWDEAQAFSMDLLPKLAALGLTGVQFPEEYGGAGMSAVDYCICIEEIARVCPSVALSVAAHNGTGILSEKNATLRIGQSTVAANAISSRTNTGGILQSYGDNHINSNGDGDPAIPTVIAKK